MAEIQNPSEELKIETNEDEQTSVTGELVQTEIVQLTVVKKII